MEILAILQAFLCLWPKSFYVQCWFTQKCGSIHLIIAWICEMLNCTFSFRSGFIISAHGILIWEYRCKSHITFSDWSDWKKLFTQKNGNFDYCAGIFLSVTKTHCVCLLCSDSLSESYIVCELHMYRAQPQAMFWFKFVLFMSMEEYLKILVLSLHYRSNANAQKKSIWRLFWKHGFLSAHSCLSTKLIVCVCCAVILWFTERIIQCLLELASTTTSQFFVQICFIGLYE